MSTSTSATLVYLELRQNEAAKRRLWRNPHSWLCAVSWRGEAGSGTAFLVVVDGVGCAGCVGTLCCWLTRHEPRSTRTPRTLVTCGRIALASTSPSERGKHALVCRGGALVRGAQMKGAPSSKSARWRRCSSVVVVGGEALHCALSARVEPECVNGRLRRGREKGEESVVGRG